MDDEVLCPYLEGPPRPARTGLADEQLPLLDALKVALGAQLGETAEQVSGWIRPARGGDRPAGVEIALPGTPVPTLLVLPRVVTDEATAAVAELDLAGEASRGHELTWDQTARTWRIHDRPAAASAVTAHRPPHGLAGNATHATAADLSHSGPSNSIRKSGY